MPEIANVTSLTKDWHAINWCKINRLVRNLRRRIFRASSEGDLKKVRRLQKLMLKSYSNIILAVRRVTQINRGKHSAGVDKVVVKTASARSKLVDTLSKLKSWQPLPTRRVHIPKSNGKQRPLGIASITDRCLQAIVKNALEPFWEARFEGCSYGFRPGRSPQDALQRVFLVACPHRTKKWVLDADIEGCFDNIRQSYLLEKIGNFPAKKLIADWLNVGVMEQGNYKETLTGVPQGGVLSPLEREYNLAWFRTSHRCQTQ